MDFSVSFSSTMVASSLLLSAFLVTLCEFNTSTVRKCLLNRSNLFSSCLFDLYTLILNSLLRAHAYPGKASHISINFSSTDTGLILKLTGFNQHLSKYVEAVLQVIADFQLNEEGSLSWKQELKDQYFREMNQSKTLIKLFNQHQLKSTD